MGCSRFPNSGRRVSNSFSIIFTLLCREKLTNLGEYNRFSKEPRPIYSQTLSISLLVPSSNLFFRFDTSSFYQVFAKFALSIYYFHQYRSKVKLNLFHFIRLLCRSLFVLSLFYNYFPILSSRLSRQHFSLRQNPERQLPRK